MTSPAVHTSPPQAGAGKLNQRGIRAILHYHDGTDGAASAQDPIDMRTSTSDPLSTFVVHIDDLGGDPSAHQIPVPLLDSSTSVARLKRDFFQALESIGRIHLFDPKRDGDSHALKTILRQPRTAFASFFERPPDLDCRLLQHTRGGLMLPGGFLGGWTFRNSTLNLVETARQAKQLQIALGESAPRLGVFAQQLADDVFRPSEPERRTASRKSLGIATQERHLVYAGRWIANKGIVQTVRALNLWPLQQGSLSMIGCYEDDFQISQCDGNHLSFRDFMEREVFSRSPNLTVRRQEPVSQRRLAEWFASADAFVCASFHEDEASGNAAHEAVLAGLPAVVTDWCGLGQLGRNTRGGAIATYATFGGVRFSLAALRSAIGASIGGSLEARTDRAERDAQWVRSVFSRDHMHAALSNAIGELWNQPPEPPPAGGWRSADRAERLTRLGHSTLRQAVMLAREPLPSGMHVDGLGCVGDPSVSLPRLLYAIQSMYTTHPVPPIVAPGSTLRGFWRSALWPSERSLVEFGFPGPRMLRLSEEDWHAIVSCARERIDGDFEFLPHSSREAAALQTPVDLGYLVPDQISPEAFSRPPLERAL